MFLVGDKLIIKVDWESLDHLNDFISSPECERHDQALQQVAISHAKCTRYMFPPFGFAFRHDLAIEFCKFYFDPEILDNGRCRENLLRSRGLKYSYGLGISGNSPAAIRCPYHNGNPSNGFSLDGRKWEGRYVKEFVFLNYWKSKESEAKFKENAQTGVMDTEDGETKCRQIKIYSEWAGDLIWHGAVGWESEHIHSKPVPSAESLRRTWERLDAQCET